MTKECLRQECLISVFFLFLVFTLTCDEPNGFLSSGFIVPHCSVLIPATCGAFCKLQSLKLTSRFVFFFLAAHL